MAKLRTLLRVRPRMFKPIIALMRGLTDPFCGLNMGQTAEVLARDFGITRQEQDEFSLLSHQRAVAATKNGTLAEEMVPIYLKGREEPLEEDIGPRDGQTIEGLAKLKPFFDRRYGTVTVGNSCPITDGAAALLLMSEARVRVLKLKPLAWIRSYGFAGLDPKRMGLGPAVATPVALKRIGLTLGDMGLIEINEAFAAQVLAVLRIFEKPSRGEYIGANASEFEKVDLDKVNVNGGAIALGHPVGTSGTRITLTLAKEMRRRGTEFGLATMCVGGGQGGSIVLEQGE